ncbi:MAG: DNA polymerase III subunit gamma/tau [Planctomycetota bacterium]
MSYQVLARKYRPQTFEEVVGQESTAETLRNAIKSGRVAHAYLFSGPRGVGKTSMARILAKALNCEKGTSPTPCNECGICRRIETGDDVDVVEIDGASNNSVDQVRQLRENVRYAPARAAYKIYIIDEVHMLSTAAFNALLKTLEEPPPHVKFIFATTEPHKLLDTIKSRCQRFDFRRIPSSSIAEHLRMICEKEEIRADDEALDAMARAAHGGMRDAESLLDQLASLAAETITVEDLTRLVGGVPQDVVLDLLGAIAQHDAKRAIEIIDETLAKGAADDELIQQLVDGFRELLLARVAGRETELIDRGESVRERLGELASTFSTDALMYLVQMFAETKKKARQSSQSRIVLELAVLKAAEIHQLRPLDELVSEVAGRGAGGRSGSGRRAGGSGRQRAQRPAKDPPKSATPPAEPARTGDVWADALAELARAKPPLATMLKDGSCTPAEGAVPSGPARFIIELDPFGVQQAEQNKPLLEKALSKAHGSRCTVELRAAADGRRRPAKRPTAQPKGEHIKKALALFNGRVVHTQDQTGKEPSDG